MAHHAHWFALRAVEELAESGLGFVRGKGLHGARSILHVEMLNLTESLDLIKWRVWFGFYSRGSCRTVQPIRAGIANMTPWRQRRLFRFLVT